MNHSNLRIGVFVPFAFLTLLGCDRSDMPDTGRVTGTATLDGVPLASARVSFTPTTARPSYGTTDADGRYELTYIRDTKGAAVGEHTVRITTGGEVEEDVDVDADTAQSGEAGGPTYIPESVPAKYNEETTLSAIVEPGDNVIDFELTTTP